MDALAIDREVLPKPPRPAPAANKSDGTEAAQAAVRDYVPVLLRGWTITLFLADLFGSVFAATVVFVIYAEPLAYRRGQLWAGELAFVVIWVLASQAQDLYGRKTLLAGLRVQLLRATFACAITFGLILFLAFGFKFIGSVSRVWLLTWAVTAYVAILLSRVCWRLWLQTQLRYGACLERALVLAAGTQNADRVSIKVERESERLIRVAASAAIPGTPGGPSLAWVEGTIRESKVDRVIIANFDTALDETNAVLRRLARLCVDVTVLPAYEGLHAPLLRPDRIGMLLAVDVDSRPLSSMQIFVKRLEDALIAAAVLILMLPVFALIGLAIKLDSPGPVFFRQRRAGFHDHTFLLLKFRTMQEALRDDASVRQTSRGDPRVTRVGRFLRRTSLDELPQFLNVLRGEMSVVGPRPHALGMTTVGLPLDELLEEYSARHRIKPGITGWAQVNGYRGEVDTEEKLRRRVVLDCYYIENWSVAFDLWIVLRTAALIFFDKRAF